MKIMLDTDMCIHLIRQRPPSVLDRIATYAPGDIGVSAITVAELEYGVSNSRQPRRNRQALEQFLSPLEVAVFDRPATVTYGRVRTHLERTGLRIGGMDLLIAAHALSANVSLVTSNEREFRRVPGLHVENWAKVR
jgi:tRNA(fMet)-specific endonuclease VapC